MDYSVVVLSARRPDVLTATAVRALREASAVVADATVPDDVRDALGAVLLEDEPPPGAVLLTTDPDRTADALAAAPDGTALLDAVAVMDRLRSPGGCPWDAEQTHASLLQYLVEECYELYDAIEQNDPRPCARSSATSSCRCCSTPASRPRRRAGSRSTTSRVCSSTSWWADTRTCSPGRSGSTRPRARSSGGRS